MRKRKKLLKSKITLELLTTKLLGFLFGLFAIQCEFIGLPTDSIKRKSLFDTVRTNYE